MIAPIAAGVTMAVGGTALAWSTFVEQATRPGIDRVRLRHVFATRAAAWVGAGLFVIVASLLF